MGDEMLRAGLGDEVWRVSLGTAEVLGLTEAPLDVAPTTAYLMLGERCAANCAFCSQARGSHTRANMLSRVTWPPFKATDVADACAAAFSRGEIGRACFQVTVGRGMVEHTIAAVREVASRSRVPICASVMPRSLEDVDALLKAGAERVTIALDAGTEAVYCRAKSGRFERVEALLEAAAEAHPGHVGTHLIVGLGETEREMVERVQWGLDRGIMVALFAFTPVPGTAMEDVPQPPLDVYRRVQAARWLMANGHARAEAMGYHEDGRIVHLGLADDELARLLADGEALRTAGCPDCNRPFYNERPGGPMYNYPRPLTPSEAQSELSALLRSLAR